MFGVLEYRTEDEKIRLAIFFISMSNLFGLLQELSGLSSRNSLCCFLNAI